MMLYILVEVVIVGLLSMVGVVVIVIFNILFCILFLMEMVMDWGVFK